MEPRDLVERGQHGVAAALRLFNNSNLIPNGPAPEHFVGAVTFDGATHTNSKPLASDEFSILTQILGELATIDSERGPTFLGLLNYVLIDCPTLPDVSSELKEEVSNTCKALQLRFGVLDLAVHTSKVTQNLKLSSAKANENNEQSSESTQSSRTKTPQIDQNKLIQSFIKDQAPNDELVALAGSLTKLSRADFILVSQRLLALAVTREEAAKALVTLSAAEHDEHVTSELRADSMSKLYRSTSKEEIRSLAMHGSQHIASLGFKSKYDFESEQGDEY